MLNEGNQIHNFISSSGSGTVINYGSGSDFLNELRFRFHKAKVTYGSYGSGSGSTTLVDTGSKFATGEVDTGGKFAASVIDTGGALSFGNISRIFEKFRHNPNIIFRGLGEHDKWKKLEAKNLVRRPLYGKIF